jgi:hypothetical protein
VILAKKHTLGQLEVEIDIINAKSIVATKFAGRWTVVVTLADDTAGEAASDDLVSALNRAMMRATKEA